MTGLLLLDGRRISPIGLVALVGLIAIVSSVANYGYALNELYDRDEDRRGGRTNVAETHTARLMWSIIGGSAGCALTIALTTGGIRALVITAVALLLPLAYSLPAVRTKNRGWLGICCDASAAHLYPAMLALSIFSQDNLRTLTPLLIATAAGWSFMTGLRGILSHQLQSEEHDRAVGLHTVVHDIGHKELVSFVTFIIVPIEIAAFVGFVAQCGTGSFVVAAAAVFVAFEALKFRLDAFPALVFTRRGQHYVPWVDEGAYKVWAPLAFAFDAAFCDIRYLLVIPLYWILFRPRLIGEAEQIRATTRLIRVRANAARGGV